MTVDKRRERLRYHSWHRGTREMDLLLGSFADAHLRAFSEEQLARYKSLLNQSDPDLYDWISGKKQPPLELHDDVMKLLTAHKFIGTGG